MSSPAFPRRARTARGVLASLAVLMLVAGCGREPEPPPPLPSGDPLSQARGEWLYVNYWAEWCGPCLEEIPELNAFARKHADRARVLMVNFDGATGPALREQAKRLGIQTVLLESNPSARFGLPVPQGLPTTYAIAPDGHVAATLLGPQTVDTLEKPMRERR